MVINDYYNDLTEDVAKVNQNGLELGYKVEDIIDGLEEYLTVTQYNRRRLEAKEPAKGFGNINANSMKKK